MFVFGNDTRARGCFERFNISSISGSGADVIIPQKIGPPANLPSAAFGSSDPMLVIGLSFAQKESFHLVKCFNDIVHTYAFGHDPASSMISVVFTGFMINDDGTGVSDVFGRFITAYETGRLSRSLQQTQVVIGRKTLLGFLVSMSSATSDAHHNLQNFTLDILATEVQQ